MKSILPKFFLLIIVSTALLTACQHKDKAGSTGTTGDTSATKVDAVNNGVDSNSAMGPMQDTAHMHDTLHR